MSILDFTWAKKFTIDDFGAQPYFENFPVLLYFQGHTPADPDYVDWSHFQGVGGADFRVYDKNGISLLDYEIDRWDDTAEEAWVHARKPLATRDGSDFIWIAYGLAGASDAQNPTGVWDDKFRAVWHMNGANWTGVTDSTRNNNDPTGDAGAPTYNQDALVGKGVSSVYPALDEINLIDNTGCLDTAGTSGALIVEMIAKPDAVNLASIAAAKWDTGGSLTNGWVIGFADNSFLWPAGKRFVMMLINHPDERGARTVADFCDGNDHHFVASWNGPELDTMTIYVDGVSVAKVDDNVQDDWPYTDNVNKIFLIGVGGKNFGGLLDEVRVSMSVTGLGETGQVRSDDWIKATYDTCFLSFGTWSAETAPPNPFQISTAQLDMLRTFPQRSKFYLGVAVGEVLYSAQLSGVADNSPPTGALRLTYPNAADWEQVRSADEIWIGTEAGTYDIGVVEPVEASASATQVDIWPTNAPIRIGHYITVRRVNHLWVRPWIVAECSAENDFLPVACIGPARLGFVNEPLSFDASPSWARNGKTISSYRWDFADASPPDNNATTTHTWTEPGEYWVEMYIVDSDGKTHTAYRPVLIFNRPGTAAPIGQVSDPIYPYTAFELENVGTTWGVGQEGAGYAAFGGGGASVRILEDCPIDDFPNWMQVVVVSEDWYGDTKATWGASDANGLGGLEYAQEVLLTAWLLESNLRQASATGDVSFNLDTIESLMGRVEFAEGFSFRAGAGLHAWATLSAEKVFLHMSETHSTLKDIIDIYKPLSLSDPEGSSAEGWGPHFSYMDLSGNLARMLGSSLGGSLGASLLSSRYGTLHFEPNVQFLSSYSPDVEMCFIKRDWWGDIGFREEVWGGVAQIVAQVLDYDIQNIEVKVPPTPDTFGVIQGLSGLIFVDKTAARVFAERYLEWKNLRFQGITLNSFNNRFLEPALQPVIAITLNEADTLRGVVWETKQFIVRSVSYNLNNKGWITTAISVEEKRA